jgi:hypothetical protein
MWSQSEWRNKEAKEKEIDHKLEEEELGRRWRKK